MVYDLNDIISITHLSNFWNLKYFGRLDGEWINGLKDCFFSVPKGSLAAHNSSQAGSGSCSIVCEHAMWMHLSLSLSYTHSLSLSLSARLMSSRWLAKCLLSKLFVFAYLCVDKKLWAGGGGGMKKLKCSKLLLYTMKMLLLWHSTEVSFTQLKSFSLKINLKCKLKYYRYSCSDMHGKLRDKP